MDHFWVVPLFERCDGCDELNWSALEHVDCRPIASSLMKGNRQKSVRNGCKMEERRNKGGGVKDRYKLAFINTRLQ